ncbi:MAG: phosphoribosylformylglycinamidine synthase [Deltaproteobacteria bacterium]|nr:phosphoribosylformylglycinamidine synthase [Deltaproteobacteria bacterium]
MPIRIETGLKPDRVDPLATKWLNRLDSSFQNRINNMRVFKTYIIDGDVPEEILHIFCESALADPVTSRYSINKHLVSDFDFVIEVDFKPGVTDNEGRTASEALKILFSSETDTPGVYSGTQFRISGDLKDFEIRSLASDFFANTLIQRIRVASYEEFLNSDSLNANPPVVNLNHEPAIIPINLTVSDQELSELSRKNVWALTVDELKIIENYYSKEDVQEVRKSLGLSSKPVDIELECFAQTWSEHCKHKIFNAQITYTEDGHEEVIDSIFKSCIKKATENVRAAAGENDICLSVFKDNAGVIRFNDEYGIVFKVETHNSPSALDPYGGSLTGIVGVNRDPFGTGMGSELLFNTNVFCLADPFGKDEIPLGLLHPMRILEGVREGVEDGGNQSGIPTINGSVVFDNRYLGKPLVYCGTGGIIPLKHMDRDGFEKYPESGHLIVMCGGRVGMDGIHGATFSSEELHEESPSSAVQIGDPITQKRMFDFLIKARDLNLYSGITDNGAGGLSSSVGEMAQFTGGARLDLAMVPLKYEGLDPWEILVSESQERMTLSVCPTKIEEFLNLSRSMSVESTVIGEFNSSGYFEILFNKRTVALMDMDFLHNGLPQMKLKAKWSSPEIFRGDFSDVPQASEMLHRLLSRLNIASKEYWVRQYDHEVKGTSVIKPLMGAENDGPSDSAVIRPFHHSMEAICVSHGICPRYSDVDAYHMTMNAFDEAVRNAIATGGDPETFAALDNFCWPDPLEGAENSEFKLASLVRSAKALLEICEAYQIPLISGKDSMKNDARVDGTVISVPPTLLISLTGILSAQNAVSMDFKNPGDLIYVAGSTRNEMGHSEYALELGIEDTAIPVVKTKEFMKIYKIIHLAMRKQFINSCHDMSDGGFGVSLAEMAIGGRTGCEINLSSFPVDVSIDPNTMLFSESAGRFILTVPQKKKLEFESLFDNSDPIALVGEVKKENRVIVKSSHETIIDETVESLFQSWHKPLEL